MATKSRKKAAPKKSAAKKAAPKKASTPQPGQLINFDNAIVRPGFVPKTYFLIVTGKKPYLNMQVDLRPLIYVMKPDYWGIQVVGTSPGIDIPVVTPYFVVIPLNGIIGKKGIEVIGANKKKKINVP